MLAWLDGVVDILDKFSWQALVYKYTEKILTLNTFSSTFVNLSAEITADIGVDQKGELPVELVRAESWINTWQGWR